jgi:hypothetical protein
VSYCCRTWPSCLQSLTPCSRVLLEKLLVAKVVKKFRKFYGTIVLIAMFTGAYPEPHESSIFFGAFATLPKAIVNFVMPIRLHGATHPPLHGFS